MFPLRGLDKDHGALMVDSWRKTLMTRKVAIIAKINRNI